MLRTRTSFPVHFPTLATRLVLQVCGSVAATLIASALVTGLPRPGVSAAPAELTSGGKFAARALDGHVEAAPATWARQTLPVLTQVAFEQPLFGQVPFEPFPAGASVDAAPAPTASAPLHSASLAEATPVHAASLAEAIPLPPEAAPRAARKPRPQPAHAERVRLPEPAPAAASQFPVTEAAGDEDGLLPRVAASARSAWTFTASAGGSLLSRLVP